jgi:hypothetical protein
LIAIAAGVAVPRLDVGSAQAAERPALGETVFRVAPSRAQSQPAFEEMAQPEPGPASQVSSVAPPQAPRAAGRPIALTPRTAGSAPAPVSVSPTVRVALPVAPQERPAVVAPTAKIEGKVVQLGAFRSRAEAEKALADWKAQVPALFAQAGPPTIMAADLGEKGTYHRVRVAGFSDSRKAGEFCGEYKGGGRDCYVVP